MTLEEILEAAHKKGISITIYNQPEESMGGWDGQPYKPWAARIWQQIARPVGATVQETNLEASTLSEVVAVLEDLVTAS